MHSFQEPESMPFRQPVDPQALGIPDYHDIVRNPMDLGTIKRKLDAGQYNDPWDYVGDMFLMFKNAWLYNRKTSRQSEKTEYEAEYKRQTTHNGHRIAAQRHDPPKRS